MQRYRQKLIRMMCIAVMTAAITGSSAALANAQPQGLYSAGQLIGSSVYTSSGHKNVGQLQDIIFDNNMTIQSFVVGTRNALGLGGKSYVVNTDQARVDTGQHSDSTHPNYTVIINFNAKQLKNQPVYSNSWWNKAKSQASDAWNQSKQSAQSAWTHIKQGSKSLLKSAERAVHSAAQSTANATNN